MAVAFVFPGAVTTIVVPPFGFVVAGAGLVLFGLGGTEAFGLGVGVAAALRLVLEVESDSDEEEPEEPCRLVTALLVPVRYTDQKFDPPPVNS